MSSISLLSCLHCDTSAGLHFAPLQQQTSVPHSEAEAAELSGILNGLNVQDVRNCVYAYVYASMRLVLILARHALQAPAFKLSLVLFCFSCGAERDPCVHLRKSMHSTDSIALNGPWLSPPEVLAAVAVVWHSTTGSAP